MAGKKETRKLIEVLLKEQRLHRPKEQNPMEGIGWAGLPDHLKGNVYKPQQQKESLNDLLDMIREEQKHPEHEPDPAPPAEAATPRRQKKKRKPAAVTVPENDLRAGYETDETDVQVATNSEAAPGLIQRLKWHFFEIFAFLNKSYEIRVATMLAFSILILVVMGLTFLLGYRSKAADDFTVLHYQGSLSHLQTAVPASVQQGAPKPRPEPKPQEQAEAPSPQLKQPEDRSGTCYVIIISNFNKQTGGKQEAIAAADFLRNNGVDAEVFPLGNYYALTVGEWQEKVKAEAMRNGLIRKLQGYDIPRVKTNNISDAYPFQFQKNDRVYP